MLCMMGGWIFSCVRAKERFEEFDKADQDEDGMISVSEFQEHYCATKGREPTFREWVQFHAADYDDDGFVSRNDVLVHDTEERFLR